IQHKSRLTCRVLTIWSVNHKIEIGRSAIATCYRFDFVPPSAALPRLDSAQQGSYDLGLPLSAEAEPTGAAEAAPLVPADTVRPRPGGPNRGSLHNRSF